MSAQAISRGTQLEVAKDWEQLCVGVKYIFLISAAQVLLVQFIEQPPRKVGKKKIKLVRPPPEVVLIHLNRERFEWAVEHDIIVASAQQEPLPPWCAGLGNTDTEHREKSRYKKKKKLHRDRTGLLLSHMSCLLSDVKAVLTAKDPLTVVNEVARMSTPKQNEQRFRAAFFSFIAYRENRNVLAYQTQNIGKWDREKHQGMKCGRKARGLGALHTFKSQDEQLLADVLQGWDVFAQLGRSIRKIYRLTCAHIWKCRSVKDERGRKRLIRPGGEPYLTYDQFYTRLLQLVGKDEVHRKLRGRGYFRENLAPSLGHFSEAVANVCERTEADGYWVEEVAIGPDGKNHLPALIVVRIICATTSMRLGIGFSLGGERGSAYRMAQFCMAVPKDFYGELFGMKIDLDDWPSEGLSDDTIVDRGPGQGAAGKAREQDGKAAINEMPPTGFGQGKALVESTHPRQIKFSDRPTFVLTSIPLLDLVRREIRETVAWNDAHDISSRLGPRRIASADRVTPLDLHNKLTAVGRNDSRRIPRAAAIRSFLTEIQLTVRPDGVYFHFQRYDSPELRKTGILERVVTGESFQITGYVLDMAIRQVWADVNGELIRANGVLHLREDNAQLDISVAELELLSEKLEEMKADLRTQREAVLVDAEAEFTEETGASSGDSTRVGGKPRRGTHEARAQGKAVKDVLTPTRMAA